MQTIEVLLKCLKESQARRLEAGCGNETNLKYLSKFYQHNSRVKLQRLEFNKKLLEIAEKKIKLEFNLTKCGKISNFWILIDMIMKMQTQTTTKLNKGNTHYGIH